MDWSEKIDITSGDLTPEKLIQVLNKIPVELQDSCMDIRIVNAQPKILEVVIMESDSEESRYLKRKFGRPDHFLSLEFR